MNVPVYHARFDGDELDPKYWNPKQIEPEQMSFVKRSSSKGRAIVITTKPDDGGKSCHGCIPCQRAEIRQKKILRPNHSSVFWQSFDFHVRGDIPEIGSVRTVISQWKAPGDDSPFLAQRFDNGVFHITVQDGEKRRTVASAKGDPDRLDAFHALVSKLGQQLDTGEISIGSLGISSCTYGELLTRIAILSGEGKDKNIATFLAALADRMSIPYEQIAALIREFDFVNDLHEYKSVASLQVKRFGLRQLPDPKKDWVSMAYRIKAGRLDNEHGPRRVGEVDIYANGQLIAEVRGNLGYWVKPDETRKTIYLKLGMYRDTMRREVDILYDNFRQGGQQSDVM